MTNIFMTKESKHNVQKCINKELIVRYANCAAINQWMYALYIHFVYNALACHLH